VEVQLHLYEPEHQVQERSQVQDSAALPWGKSSGTHFIVGRVAQKLILTPWNLATKVRAENQVVIPYHSDCGDPELGTKVKWFCFEFKVCKSVHHHHHYSVPINQQC
jgi:hypothetical protein